MYENSSCSTFLSKLGILSLFNSHHSAGRIIVLLLFLAYLLFVFQRSAQNSSVLVSLGCYNKIPQTGWLKPQALISLEFWRLEFWDQNQFGLSPLLSLQTTTILLCAHVAFPGSRSMERDSFLPPSLLSFYEDTNPVTGSQPSWPHLNLIISQRLHLQILSHWG